MPTFASVNGNAPLYYVAITITNSQTTATPAPFQQMITINSSSYSSYLASNLQNVNFQDGNGNIIPSWLESGNSNTSTSTIYWVSLANGIGASSSVTIYYCIYATSVNCFNTTNTGVAPQLTTTYAQYDDGASVFNNYWNFAGTSLPSGLSYVNSGSTITINNGATVTQPTSDSGYAWIYTTSALPAGEVIEVNQQTSNSELNTRLGWSTSTSLGGQYTFYNSYDNNIGGSQLNGVGITSSSSFGITVTPTVTAYMNGIFSFAWLATGSQWYAYNYTSGTSSDTTSSITSTLYGYYGVGDYGYTTGSVDTQLIYWLRTRAYPPNGTMPSTSLGSLTATTIVVPTITYSSEGETYSIPTLIKQPLTYSTESETEQQILTTLEAGSLLQTINYSESETETLKPQSIFQTINYKQRENYNIQTEIEAKFIYDNNETEKEWLSLLGIPPIKYNNTSLYSILYNNTLSDSKGNFINNLYMHIPFNQTLYPKQINYNLTSSYLPPETNVSTVYASDIIPINFNFTFNISLSANTTTYVVTATVTDSAGNAIPNVVVNFSASGGTVSPTSATTNSSGQCTTTASGANVTVTANATLLGVTITSASVTT